MFWSSGLANLASYLRYKLDLLDIERWTRRALGRFEGQREEALIQESELWFETYVRPTIYPEALELVRGHQAAGHVVALVSGATRYVSQPLADYLNVKHVMHTRLEVRAGRLTGRVIEPLCFGEGKVYWLKQLIEAEQIDLARSHFYTDSITDLPLLDLVGHPEVVNPDPLLYRRAIARRWPIRFFEMPN